jgi:hypothetical protein
MAGVSRGRNGIMECGALRRIINPALSFSRQTLYGTRLEAAAEARHKLAALRAFGPIPQDPAPPARTMSMPAP